MDSMYGNKPKVDGLPEFVPFTVNALTDILKKQKKQKNALII